jgi:Flp pilus assembly protein TadB
LSYRLVFGQTLAARRLATKELKRLQDDGEDIDAFLIELCTSSHNRKIKALPSELWPSTCRNFEGALQEQNTYSSQDDFPLFGERLARLQEFVQRQQPSELADLWRDRRAPLQWYTFWAVLLFGGATLVLASLQLIVGILQVVLPLVIKT